MPRDSGSISPRRTRSHHILRENLRLARQLVGGTLPAQLSESLKNLSQDFDFYLSNGELQVISNSWYVTHTGLLRLARRKTCRGIHVEAVDSLCDSAANRYVLKATVYPSKDSAGFVCVEMRIAETRAVNCALPSLLITFPLWFAFLTWRPQAIGALPYLCQSALKEELDLLIRRAVLPFREFSDLRFQALSYSNKYRNSGFVHFANHQEFLLLLRYRSDII
jgi:hypothetical protein